MKIYPKREYLTFGNSPKKTPRIIYLMGAYAESDDFRGFKNPVSRIRMSLDNFLRHGKTIYDTGGYQLVGEPECEPIIELFYDIEDLSINDLLKKEKSVTNRSCENN